VQQWLGQQGFFVMEWPPQSLDLNPIKHLWNEVDRHLGLSSNLPRNTDDLWKKIYVVWQSTKVEYVHKLIHTIPFLQLRMDTHTLIGL